MLKPLIPDASPGGRPRKTDIRSAMNAILYLLRTGCPWRYLPRDGFPPRSTVYNAAAVNGLRLEVARRNPKAVGFEVINRRWVVERTFSWFGRNRRFAKDFENLADSVLAFVTFAAIQFGTRRLARR